MNMYIKFAAILLVITAGACTMETTTASRPYPNSNPYPRSGPGAPSQDVDVSFQLFYDNLSPYGTWVNYQDYGYAWVPDVDRDFSPYSTAGHWVYTDAGWTWFSDYSWGWAPFHYGRWAYDDSYGWLWMPQNEWGPAWVTWRRSEGYYGWAPMGPGVSVDLSFGGGSRVPSDRWTFVRDRDINRPDIDRVYIDRSTNITIINTSTVINNTYVDNSRNTKYVAGPGRDDVQRVVGATIKPVTIREESRPGQALSNDQLQIYRPRVREGSANDRTHAPARLVELKELKPASERRQGHQMRNDNSPAGGNDRSAPPVIPPPPPGNRDAGRQEQPVVVPPSQDNTPPQRERPVRPPDDRGRQQQPVVIPPVPEAPTPPVDRSAPPRDQGKRQQPVVIPPVPEAPTPPVDRSAPPHEQGRRQQPVVIPPVPESATPPDERSARQHDPRGRQQQPVVTPPAQENVTPPNERSAKPHDSRGRQLQQPDVNPADSSRTLDRSRVKPGQALDAKGRLRDPQPRGKRRRPVEAKP